MARPAKNYVKLEFVLDNLVHNKSRRVIMEKRPVKYMFGLKNYGEIPGWYNRADGDCWDVFAPGYARRLPFDRPYVVIGIMGFLDMDNRNHKIAVRLAIPGFDASRAKAEIATYVQQYTSARNRAGTWREFIPPGLRHHPTRLDRSPTRSRPMSMAERRPSRRSPPAAQARRYQHRPRPTGKIASRVQRVRQTPRS